MRVGLGLSISPPNHDDARGVVSGPFNESRGYVEKRFRSPQWNLLERAEALTHGAKKPVAMRRSDAWAFNEFWVYLQNRCIVDQHIRETLVAAFLQLPPILGAPQSRLSAAFHKIDKGVTNRNHHFDAFRGCASCFAVNHFLAVSISSKKAASFLGPWRMLVARTHMLTRAFIEKFAPT